MVNRVVSIGLLAVYLTFSAGVLVMIHTCGGSQTFEFMPVSAEDPCGCSDLTSDDACCTLSLRAFHIDDDQNAAPRVSTASATDVCAVLPVEAQSAFMAAAMRPVSITSSPPQQVSPITLGCALLI
jgi:hypothetical protein